MEENKTELVITVADLNCMYDSRTVQHRFAAKIASNTQRRNGKVPVTLVICRSFVC